MKACVRSFLTDLFGSDAETLAELYAQYREDLLAATDGLSALVAHGDCAALGQRGHAVKGMALAVGDTEMSELGLALQISGRSGALDKASADVAALLSAVAELDEA